MPVSFLQYSRQFVHTISGRPTDLVMLEDLLKFDIIYTCERVLGCIF